MKKRDKKLLLGAHMSITGGLHNALTKGAALGCSTIQLFVKNNRQWHVKPLTEEQIELFRQTAEIKGFNKNDIIAHATYLINIGSPSLTVSAQSAQTLRQELIICSQLEIPYLVLHPGSHVQTDSRRCLEQIAATLTTLLSDPSITTRIALELMAGQGSVVGSTLEELATIISLLSPEIQDRVGVCVDTCHMFAAGYPFTTLQDYEAFWHHFDAVLGLDKLALIHINDSKKPCGSKVDRHEHIGQGLIGLEIFRFLFNDERFFDIPKILETPKKSEHDDAMNIATIKSLLNQKTKDKLFIDII